MQDHDLLRNLLTENIHLSSTEKYRGIIFKISIPSNFTCLTLLLLPIEQNKAKASSKMNQWNSIDWLYDARLTSSILRSVWLSQATGAILLALCWNIYIQKLDGT